MQHARIIDRHVQSPKLITHDVLMVHVLQYQGQVKPGDRSRRSSFTRSSGSQNAEPDRLRDAPEPRMRPSGSAGGTRTTLAHLFLTAQWVVERGALLIKGSYGLKRPLSDQDKALLARVPGVSYVIEANPDVELPEILSDMEKR